MCGLFRKDETRQFVNMQRMAPKQQATRGQQGLRVGRSGACGIVHVRVFAGG